MITQYLPVSILLFFSLIKWLKTKSPVAAVRPGFVLKSLLRLCFATLRSYVCIQIMLFKIIAENAAPHRCGQGITCRTAAFGCGQKRGIT
jgi:hypothetical protein